MSYWDDACVVTAGATAAALGAHNWGHPPVGVALVAFGTFLAAYGLFSGIETAVIAGNAAQSTEERTTDDAQTANEK